MRVYVMTDLEGTAGVLSADDYIFRGSCYLPLARRLATQEVNAAVEGALEAGATEVLVMDGHGVGGLDWRFIHPRAQLLAGRPLDYPFGLTSDFDAVMFVGQHAMSNTDGGHLCHTGSFAIEEQVLNGIAIGELAEFMMCASCLDVPVVTVTGDAAACAEATCLVPEIQTAAVKVGIRRGSASGLTEDENRLYNGAAVHLSPAAAREAIREAARRGLSGRLEMGLYWVGPPYEMVYRYRARRHGRPPDLVSRGRDYMAVLNRAGQSL
ncbi:MAG: hypothetical protein HPY83_05850 [Anaerolineae bacterium]|nr:hypothetical protein [Anaerolineae bacterium]